MQLPLRLSATLTGDLGLMVWSQPSLFKTAYGRSGPELSAWLVLVPRQYSTGRVDAFTRDLRSRVTRVMSSLTAKQWLILLGSFGGPLETRTLMLLRRASEGAWLQPRSAACNCPGPL